MIEDLTKAIMAARIDALEQLLIECNIFTREQIITKTKETLPHYLTDDTREAAKSFGLMEEKQK